MPVVLFRVAGVGDGFFTFSTHDVRASSRCTWLDSRARRRPRVRTVHRYALGLHRKIGKPPPLASCKRLRLNLHLAKKLAMAFTESVDKHAWKDDHPDKEALKRAKLAKVEGMPESFETKALGTLPNCCHDVLRDFKRPFKRQLPPRPRMRNPVCKGEEGSLEMLDVVEEDRVGL